MYTPIISIIFGFLSITFVVSIKVQEEIIDGLPEQCTTNVVHKPFVKVGHKLYLINANEKLNWFGAAHVCRQHDGHLATIDSESEMLELVDYLRKHYNKSLWYWTGANDLAVEGQYQWLGTGKSLTYANWEFGEPNNMDGNEHCAVLWKLGPEFKLNDINCMTRANYICQINDPKTIVMTVW